MQTVATVKALLEVRASLVADLEGHQTAIRQILKKLEGVDSTLELFDYEPDRSKLLRQNARGEIAKFVLTAVRQTNRGLTTEELARLIMADRNMDQGDLSLVQSVTRRVRGCVNHYRRSAVLESRENDFGLLEWFIAG